MPVIRLCSCLACFPSANSDRFRPLITDQLVRRPWNDITSYAAASFFDEIFQHIHLFVSADKRPARKAETQHRIRFTNSPLSRHSHGMAGRWSVAESSAVLTRLRHFPDAPSGIRKAFCRFLPVRSEIFTRKPLNLPAGRTQSAGLTTNDTRPG